MFHISSVTGWRCWLSAGGREAPAWPPSSASRTAGASAAASLTPPTGWARVRVRAGQTAERANRNFKKRKVGVVGDHDIWIIMATLSVNQFKIVTNTVKEVCMCVCHHFGPSWLLTVRRLKLGNPSYVSLGHFHSDLIENRGHSLTVCLCEGDQFFQVRERFKKGNLSR